MTRCLSQSFLKNEWHSCVILHIKDHGIHKDVRIPDFHHESLNDSLRVPDRQISKFKEEANL
jgi:hypothetical protein